MNPLITGLIARDSQKEQSPETDGCDSYKNAFGHS
jgi:hypothetical protein